MSGRWSAWGLKEDPWGQNFKKIKSWSIIIILRLSEAPGNACPFAKAGLWEVFNGNGIPRSAAVELKR
jgi:hypothetical protein